MGKIIYALLLISGVSLLLNLLWENLQAPLYQGYTNFWAHLPICSFSAFGDVIIILIPYAMIAIFRKNPLWVQSVTSKDILFSVATSAGIAIGYEWFALHVGRWQYTDAMPIVPLLHIGLVPLLQMVVVPAVTLYFTYLIVKKNKYL